jgi:hypothetical protein
MASASQSALFYLRRTVPLRSSSDLLYLSAEKHDARTPVALDLLAYLSASESFRDGAVILPEGSIFHYMLRTPSAIPLASLMPLELELITPQRVLGMIESDSPDLIVFAEPDLSLWRDLEGPDGHPYDVVRERIISTYCLRDIFGNARSDEFQMEVSVYENCIRAGPSF